MLTYEELTDHQKYQVRRWIANMPNKEQVEIARQHLIETYGSIENVQRVVCSL